MTGLASIVFGISGLLVVAWLTLTAVRAAKVRQELNMRKWEADVEAGGQRAEAEQPADDGNVE